MFFEHAEPGAHLGERANGLVQLARLGLPVAPGIIVPATKVTDPDDALAAALEKLQQPSGRVAIRMAARAASAPRAILDVPLSDATAVREAMRQMLNGADRIIVQSMVEASLWGHVYTRQPLNGLKLFTGSVFREPPAMETIEGMPISVLQAEFPYACEALVVACRQLEAQARDAQRVDFAVVNDTLFLLGTRSFARPLEADCQIVVDMANEGLITRREAVLRVSPAALHQFTLSAFIPSAAKRAERLGLFIGQGTGVQGGAANGPVTFSADGVMRLALQGQRPILVCERLLPSAREAVRYLGGLVAWAETAGSAAALTARRWGWPCVVNFDGWKLDVEEGCVRTPIRQLSEGDIVSIDGTAGSMYAGPVEFKIPQVLPAPTDTLLGWADDVSRMKVRAKADIPYEIELANAFGAHGVGLCRIESIMLDAECYPLLQYILRNALCGVTVEATVLEDLERHVRDGLYTLVDTLKTPAGPIPVPFLIRLLDTPLQQLLPAVEIAPGVQACEANPFLGLRAARLGILAPTLLDVQLRAIFGAAVQLKACNKFVRLEIMVPGVSHVNEVLHTKRRVKEIASAVFQEQKTSLAYEVNELLLSKRPMKEAARGIFEKRKTSVPYEVGAILEWPAACLCADVLAAECEFLSFGTNDLTQAVFGFSREDAHLGFMPAYLEHGIIPRDPFLSIDPDTVGEMMRIAIKRARTKKQGIEIGMCGDHGHDVDSVTLCHKLGLDYVSCYPQHVPAARLAAAHAALLESTG